MGSAVFAGFSAETFELKRAEFLEFLQKPRVAASFWREPEAGRLDTWRKEGLEVVELRADMAETPDRASMRSLAGHFGEFPRIFTARSASEGGHWRGDEASRQRLLIDALDFCSAVDVEMSSDILPQVAAAAHEKDRALIVSQHNFDAADLLEEMECSAERAFAAGADIFKTACMVSSPEDLSALRKFARRWRRKPVIVIGMGDSADVRQARLELPAEGSCIAFAVADKASAPGQLSIAETSAALIRIRQSLAETRAAARAAWAEALSAAWAADEARTAKKLVALATAEVVRLAEEGRGKWDVRRQRYLPTIHGSNRWGIIPQMP